MKRFLLAMFGMALAVPALAQPAPQLGTTQILVRDPVTALLAYGSGNSLGQLNVYNGGVVPTYSAAKRALALAATPTDAVVIVGSATKTVRIRRIGLSCAAATATQVIPLEILKRSAAGSGGTSTAATVVPNDSGSAAGTAVVNLFTANPTVGTPVGVVRAPVVSCALLTTAGANVTLSFSEFNDQPIVLRGVAESLAINLAGVTLANATTLNVDVEWTEE